MRIAFVGAVESSLVAFRVLVESFAPPVLVLTLPPEAASRHSDFSDLATPARAVGSAVHLTKDVNAPESVAVLGAAKPDLTIVVGWSQICAAEFRTAARLGTLGYHPSPLPRFRGRAVIPWTIIANETVTGSTIFWLDGGVDSGPIIVQERFPVAPEETARSLYNKHMQVLPRLVVQAVSRVARGDASGQPQDDAEASYCARRTAADGLIDWHRPAETVLRLIRAVGEPYPGAFTFEGHEKITIETARWSAGRGRFVGIVGQVQSYTESGFTVLCGDGRVAEILRWRNGSGCRPKMHVKLGSGPPSLSALTDLPTKLAAETSA